MSTDLAITATQTTWSNAQVAALAQLGVQDASPEDLAVFLHQAQRTGLDPFARQIYMIGRWDSRSGRMRQTIQTSIDGFRVVAARRAADMGVPLSISAARLADPRTGEWREVLPTGVLPLAAKVTVRLGDGTFEAVALMEEYQQRGKGGTPMGLWGRMPTTMLAKCAEALALRKACPMDLSGLYTVDEMTQVDAAIPHAPQAPSETGRHRLVRTHLEAAGIDDVSVDDVLTQAGADGVPMTPDALASWLAHTYPTTTDADGAADAEEVTAGE